MVEPIHIGQTTEHPTYYFIRDPSQQITPKIFDSLVVAASYYPTGFEYKDSFQMGTSTGREVLIEKVPGGTYRFPHGLLEDITAVLDAYELEYNVSRLPLPDLGYMGLTWNKKYDLFEDQKQAVKSLMQEDGGVLCIPTGGGKTISALYTIYSYNTPTLICVNRRELLYQWKQAIREVLDYTPGIVAGGEEDWADITVAMIQTLRIRPMPRDMNFNILCIDEAHHTPAETLYNVAMRSRASIKIGLTATPRREDGADIKMRGALGPIVYKITPIDMIQSGRIAQPHFVFLKAPQPDEKLKLNDGYATIYSKGIVRNRPRNLLIARTAFKYLKEGKSVYVHVDQVKHGKLLSSLIPDSKFIYGSSPTELRRDVLRKFKEGQVKCLISTLLGEGVDMPLMDVIILASGRKSEISTIQKIGRSLRVTTDKDLATVVDFIDNCKYLNDHWLQRYMVYKEYYGDYCPDL